MKEENVAEMLSTFSEMFREQIKSDPWNIPVKCKWIINIDGLDQKDPRTFTIEIGFEYYFKSGPERTWHRPWAKFQYTANDNGKFDWDDIYKNTLKRLFEHVWLGENDFDLTKISNGEVTPIAVSGEDRTDSYWFGNVRGMMKSYLKKINKDGPETGK